MTTTTPGRLTHLISAQDLDFDTTTLLLDTAEQMLPIAERQRPSAPTLRGKVVCNLFLEDSTRTRLSFDIAAKRLSAETITFSKAGSSISKGESFKDTALTLNAMGVDCVVLRSRSSGAPTLLSRYIDVPIINAGDGWHQHPTQALLDAFTLRQHFGSLTDRRIILVGDILHSRVARSLVQVLTTLGAKMRLVAPKTLLPPGVHAWPVETANTLDEALAPKDADAVYMLRVQRERMDRAFFPSAGEYSQLWGMNMRRLATLPEHAIVMHPGPMNRGVEIAADVADAPQSVITEQVTNGIAVRMACLYHVFFGDEDLHQEDAR